MECTLESTVQRSWSEPGVNSGADSGVTLAWNLYLLCRGNSGVNSGVHPGVNSGMDSGVALE